MAKIVVLMEIICRIGIFLHFILYLKKCCVENIKYKNVKLLCTIFESGDFHFIHIKGKIFLRFNARKEINFLR